MDSEWRDALPNLSLMTCIPVAPGSSSTSRSSFGTEVASVRLREDRRTRRHRFAHLYFGMNHSGLCNGHVSTARCCWSCIVLLMTYTTALMTSYRHMMSNPSMASWYRPSPFRSMCNASRLVLMEARMNTVFNERYTKFYQYTNIRLKCLICSWASSHVSVFYSQNATMSIQWILSIA